MMDTLLAIDQGTHASRAVLYDKQGRKLSQSVQTIRINYINAITVEQNAEEILLSVRKVIDEVLQKSSGVVAASLATQRSTLVAWHRYSGQALAPAISWMDRRCASWMKGLDEYKATVHDYTGLPLSPHYLAGKMRWLLDHNPRVRAAYEGDVLMLGSLSSFLCFHLLQGQPYVMDHSHALRSLLCDLRTLQWSADLLALFQLDERVLPDCVPTQYAYGNLNHYQLPLRSVCGDQNAALFARGELEKGALYINLGSGAFMLYPCGDNAIVHQQLLSGIASTKDQHATYLLEGTVNGAGVALSWLQEQYPGVDLLAGLPHWLEVIDTPPCFMNAVGGVGSPWWAEMESHFIPSSHDYAPQAVAVVESIVFLMQHNIKALGRQALRRIYISGGLSRLDGLCQKLADLSGLSVLRYEDPEATARGAAWLVNVDAQSWCAQVVADTFKPRSNPLLRERYVKLTEVLIKTLSADTSWANDMMSEV